MIKRIRNWLAFTIYSLVLVGVPMVQNVGLAAPSQPTYQMVCSTGTSCGDCC